MKNFKSLALSVVGVCLTFLTYCQTDRNQLEVGDKAPHFKPYKWIKGTPFPEFKKGQMYLVEFGATWCKPCIAAIPEMTSMAEQFKNQMTVVSIFVMEHNTKPVNEIPDYLDRVQKFVEKKGNEIGYTIAVDDPQSSMETEWLKAAGKTGIPYAFVIDKAGNIAWIGSSMTRAKQVITKLLRGTPLVTKDGSDKPGVTFKRIRDIVESEPNTIKSISFISIYEQGHQIEKGTQNFSYVESFQWAGMDSELAARKNKVQVVGETLRKLYYMAYGDTLWNYPLMMNPATGVYPDTIKWPNQKRSYGKYWYRPILEIKDSALFESNYHYPDNRFNYYLKVPNGKGAARDMQKKMQHDLYDFFGYEVSVEERMMPCWKLTVEESAKKKLRSRAVDNTYKTYLDDVGNRHWINAEVRDIIYQLETGYGHGAFGTLVDHPDVQPPFIDNTGIEYKIDYYYPLDFLEKLRAQYAGGRKVTFEEYKTMLAGIGIELIKSSKQMKVVVIREHDVDKKN